MVNIIKKIKNRKNEMNIRKIEEKREFNSLLNSNIIVSSEQGPLTLLSLDMLSETMFYDSIWKLKFEKKDRSNIYYDLTQFDDTEPIWLLKKIKECNTFDDIIALDKKNVIYYD